MGFVKLPDNLPRWAWYGDNNTMLVYIRLLLGAVWHETVFQNVTLQRGQIATTLPQIAKENGLSVRQVRTAIDRLKSTGKITERIIPKLRIITLIDYDCDNICDRQNDRETTDKRQASDRTTLLNTDIQSNRHTDKNITHKSRNVSEDEGFDKSHQAYPKKTKNITHKSSDISEDEGFDKFWQAYPKKTAKQQAIKAWQKLNPDEELREAILLSLERQKQSVQWTKDNGQFIPYPATWLNGRRWEDEETNAVQKTTSYEDAYNDPNYIGI